MSTEQENKGNKSYMDSKKNNYGIHYSLHLLEQYKLYVQMMDKTTDRRSKMNTFYISLLSSLLALLSLLVNNGNRFFSEQPLILLLFFSILGICLCYVWHLNIDSYKQLNSLKFKVISEMESHLPFPCYDREWKIDKKQRDKYRRLTTIEKRVPLILVTPYICLLIYSLYKIVATI